MTFTPRRSRFASPTHTNVPVTITPPIGGTRLDQQWRDAARLQLDKQHPTSINNDPTYVS